MERHVRNVAIGNDAELIGIIESGAAVGSNAKLSVRSAERPDAAAGAGRSPSHRADAGAQPTVRDAEPRRRCSAEEVYRGPHVGRAGNECVVVIGTTFELADERRTEMVDVDFSVGV